jgi:hypothetical protein
MDPLFMVTSTNLPGGPAATSCSMTPVGERFDPW